MSRLAEIFWKSILKGTLKLSFIKRDTCFCDINFNCNINNEEGVNRFLYERNKRND